MEFKDWVLYMFQKADLNSINLVCTITDSIWLARNLTLHEDKVSTVQDIVEIATNNNNRLRQVQENRSNMQTPNRQKDRSVNNNSNIHARNVIQQPSDQSQNHQVTWVPPPACFYKINCDASLANPGEWGIGIIARDEMGRTIAAATSRLPGDSNALEAEAHTLFQTVAFAKDLCLRRVMF